MKSEGYCELCKRYIPCSLICIGCSESDFILPVKERGFFFKTIEFFTKDGQVITASEMQNREKEMEFLIPKFSLLNEIYEFLKRHSDEHDVYANASPCSYKNVQNIMPYVRENFHQVM